MIRYDDRERTITLSVGDLVQLGSAGGHLVHDVVQSSALRLAQGREVHVAFQAERADLDAGFEAEVRVRHQIAVGAWTVWVQGRLDGLSRDGDRLVVEEVKSSALGADVLFATTLADWPRYVAQVELYLWMLDAARHGAVAGRLVFVSLLDGSRHVLGVPLDASRTEAVVRRQLEALVSDREAWLAWLEARRDQVVPPPFPAWRPGQEAIAAQVEAGLGVPEAVLVEAPTGLGKTAAVLFAALRLALRTDRQVFWATARTTQQEVVERTAALLAAEGLSLRAVTLTARDKACINDVVACRPDACTFAHAYHDKVRDEGVVEEVLRHGAGGRVVLRELGRRHEVCPYQLAFDATVRADLVIGDYNYAFEPHVRSRGVLAADPTRWIVVVDEAHQLVERARGYASPRVEARLAEQAIVAFERVDPERYAPFLDIAREVADAIEQSQHRVDGPVRHGVGQASLAPRTWRDLADRVDEVGLDYARLRSVAPITAVGAEDPWLELARQVLRLAGALAERDEATVALVSSVRRDRWVGLLCLDPSSWLGPWLAQLGGLVLCSATLTPTAFYRDLLGLDPDRVRCVEARSPFPPEHLEVLVAPRVSTAFRDRASQAPATAGLISRCVCAVPGNVAVYFPSFAMLDDLVARLDLQEREVLAQGRGMSEDSRRDLLDRLAAPGPPRVLAAVLGGVFAEGIDLPPGALSAIVVVGPALPPVGLARDLLRAYYEDRYGEGFRYASLVPGMTKVVQAAGRLIRRPEDRGVVVLVGRRFRYREYASLIPAYWAPGVPEVAEVAVAAFWDSP